MTPAQAALKFILGSAKAALEVAREELPKTATSQELEDYAVELMKRVAPLVGSPKKPA